MVFSGKRIGRKKVERGDKSKKQKGERKEKRPYSKQIVNMTDFYIKNNIPRGKMR